MDWALVNDVLPCKENNAKDLAVWGLSLSVPATVAPFVAGPLLDSFQEVGKKLEMNGLGYAVIYSIAAFFFLLSALLIRYVKKTSVKKEIELKNPFEKEGILPHDEDQQFK